MTKTTTVSVLQTKRVDQLAPTHIPIISHPYDPEWRPAHLLDLRLGETSQVPDFLCSIGIQRGFFLVHDDVLRSSRLSFPLAALAAFTSLLLVFRPSRAVQVGEETPPSVLSVLPSRIRTEQDGLRFRVWRAC
jgi:hypothetical protein